MNNAAVNNDDKRMKILHISDSDLNGGAAVAAYNLHQSLIEFGINSQMLVRDKRSNDSTVFSGRDLLTSIHSKLHPKLSLFPVKLYSKRKKSFFSTNFLGADHTSIVEKYNPDIIHLHWVAGGWASYEWINKINIPVVWTMHDMWPFTGGCHYSGSCVKYENSCGRCPILNSNNTNDISAKFLSKKKRFFSSKIDRLVAPSKWLAQCAKNSAVFKGCNITHIKYGIDLNIFITAEKSISRDKLGLPLNKKIILTGASDITSDPRKGWESILNVVKELGKQDKAKEILLVVFGTNHEVVTRENLYGIETLFMGTITNQLHLATLYSSANLFLSTYQEDNLPNVLIESIACGTPIVALANGGIPDIVTNEISGILVENNEPQEMAQSILKLIDDQSKLDYLSKEARVHATKNFSLEIQRQKYMELYTDIIAK